MVISLGQRPYDTGCCRRIVTPRRASRIMDPIADTAGQTRSPLEELVQQTREKFLAGFEQMVMKQVDPVLERTKAMLLGSSEAIVREQAEPLLGRFRDVLVEALSEAAQRQLQPLTQQLHDTTLQVTE